MEIKNFVALVSGGKDSIFTAMQCVARGWKLVGIANLYPASGKETDSYMYQSVGSEMVKAIGDAIGVPVYRREIKGKPLSVDLIYKAESPDDEVEDLFELLKEVRIELEKQGVKLHAISAGAILSSYQKDRVENVCKRLSLEALAPLWKMDQAKLFDYFRIWDLDAVVMKVCTLGLDAKHLGLRLRDLREHLFKINTEFGVSICGEGGEYESLVLDCPLFKQKIIIDETEVIVHDSSIYSPVLYLIIKKFHLESKPDHNPLTAISKYHSLFPL